MYMYFDMICYVFSEIIRSNNMFIGAACRSAVNEGRGDFMPIFLSDIPLLFRRKIIQLDAALVQVTPPDKHGFCSLGGSVDCTRSAVQNAGYIIGESSLKRLSDKQPHTVA